MSQLLGRSLAGRRAGRGRCVRRARRRSCAGLTPRASARVRAKKRKHGRDGADRPAATKRGQPNVQALGVAGDRRDRRVVYARNPDSERPIASISKLAAMLVVMDKGLELEGLSTINKTDVEVAKGGAKSRLLEGMTLSNRDLLHAAMMGSDNRAVPALGRAVKLNPAAAGRRDEREGEASSGSRTRGSWSRPACRSTTCPRRARRSRC